ncbi:MAG: PAS domain S-box protein [Candidatus Omnitrophota bacterium]
MKKSDKREIKTKKSGLFFLTDGINLRDCVREQAVLVQAFAALLDAERDAIIIRDMEGIIVFWNRGAAELFGWSKEQALERKYSSLQGIVYPLPFDEIMHQLEIGGKWEGEIVYQPAGAQPAYLESRLCLQKDIKGRPIAILEILTDITSRKNIEAVLRAKEQHFRYIAENISDLIGTIDLNMHLTYVSANVPRVLGFTVEEVMRKDLQGMLTPESFERARNIVVQQLAVDKAPCQDPNRTFPVEVEIYNKDGGTRLFEIKVNFIRDANGEPDNLVGVARDITEQKNAEKGLKEKQDRYVSLLRNFQGIVFRVDFNGGVAVFEGMVEKVTGYTREDFIEGRVKWERLIFPDDFESMKKVWEQARTVPDYTCEREYRVIRADQQIIWVRDRIHNIRGESGAPAFIEGTVVDITAHKKANEDLLWLASFPELNPNPIVEAGLDGKVYYMSPAALRLFPGLEALGLKHPYCAGLRWVLDRITSEKRQSFNREVEVNGLWYLQKIFAIENSTRMRIYGVDITENKLIAQRSRQLTHQLADIIDFLPDATFVIDRHKRVIAWNRALEELTGMKKEEITGKNDYEYAIPFYGKRRPILIDLIFKTDKEIESRYTYIKRVKKTLFAEVFVPNLNKGKGMFLWIKASPFYDEKGAVIGAIETVRDVSEHKESEAILRQDREVFESLVQSKTEQLLHVQKELADTRHLSEIGALAATIAHELRNPLAAIRTAVYNVRRKTQETNLTSHLDNIDKKVLESDQIINNLLSYSRIKTPQLERVNIHELLEECINAAGDRFPKYNVTVRKKCTCKKKDFLRADPLHMKELFNNILNNAYESFERKKGNVTVNAEYVHGKHFTVSFADNGSGISPENMKKISGPFFTTKSKGTGLGLTVCQQLVSLHNGTMDIKSQEGKGTTVTVTLPAGGYDG